MIKKVGVLFFLSLLLVSLSIVCVSAKISLSETSGTYNLGDSIYTTVTLTPQSVRGIFEINLVCEGQTVNLYKISPAQSSFSVGEEQKINHEILLLPEYIGNLSGSCYVSAKIADETASTKPFQISDSIAITATLDKENYNPGEIVILNLNAVKANGKNLNGFVEGSGAFDFSSNVDNGVRKETLMLEENEESGDYELILNVYDRDTETLRILNIGNISLKFKVNQVPFSLPISLGSLEARPGENYEFGLDLYDQSGKEMNGSVSVLLIPPNGKETPLTVNSGSTGSVTLQTNSTPGTWRILASFGELEDEKEFTVLDLEKIEFGFIEETSLLVIRNIGNVPYDEAIEIQIGGNIETLNLNIGVGEERRFRLKAPDGEYTVRVASGDSQVERTLLLTGRAISVRDSGGLNVLSSYPIIWIFIGIVLVALAIILLMKYRKKTFRLKDGIKMPHFRRHKETSVVPESVHDREMLDVSRPKIAGAESSLVLNGDKETAAVIALKVKSKLGQQGKEDLKKIIMDIWEGKGMIEKKDEYIMMVFSPLVTKTFSNEMIAIKAANKLFGVLEQHNKKYNDKINFGIGVHVGEIIANLEGKKLKYTGMGNTISLVKKMADISGNKLLVSEKLRNKMARALKVEKAGEIGKTQIFEVTKLANVEANQERLHEILKRMSREEKHDKELKKDD